MRVGSLNREPDLRLGEVEQGSEVRLSDGGGSSGGTGGIDL